MTETLAQKTCTPCRGGVPPLARDEAMRFQSQAPEWVNVQVSQPTATRSSHQPISEMLLPVT